MITDEVAKTGFSRNDSCSHLGSNIEEMTATAVNDINNTKNDTGFRISALLCLHSIMFLRLEHEQRDYLERGLLKPRFISVAKHDPQGTIMFLVGSLAMLSTLAKALTDRPLTMKSYNKLRGLEMRKADLSLPCITDHVPIEYFGQTLHNVSPRAVIKVSRFAREQGLKNFATTLEKALASTAQPTPYQN